VFGVLSRRPAAPGYSAFIDILQATGPRQVRYGFDHVHGLANVSGLFRGVAPSSAVLSNYPLQDCLHLGGVGALARTEHW